MAEICCEVSLQLCCCEACLQGGAGGGDCMEDYDICQSCCLNSAAALIVSSPFVTIAAMVLALQNGGAEALTDDILDFYGPGNSTWPPCSGTCPQRVLATMFGTSTFLLCLLPIATAYFLSKKSKTKEEEREEDKMPQHVVIGFGIFALNAWALSRVIAGVEPAARYFSYSTCIWGVLLLLFVPLYCLFMSSDKQRKAESSKETEQSPDLENGCSNPAEEGNLPLDPNSTPAEEGATLREGDRVVVGGLKGAPQHNGVAGKVMGYNPSNTRYTVTRDTGAWIAVKRSNLTKEEEPEDLPLHLNLNDIPLAQAVSARGVAEMDRDGVPVPRAKEVLF